MPGVEHVISFHAILSGSCWAALSDGSAPALNLNAGDVVVFPGGAPNVMGSEAGARGEPDMAMYYKPVDKHLPFTLIRGGEGRSGLALSAAISAATRGRLTRCSRRFPRCCA